MPLHDQPKRSIKLKSPFVPAVLVILLGVQIFFPFKGWVILLSGFGGMWLLSFAWAYSLKRHLSIHRQAKFGWKQVGDRLRERVILENMGWAPCLWVEINDHSDMRNYDISAVTEIRSGRTQNWHTQGVCDYRGLYTLGPITLETGDPFGIYKVSVDYLESVNMMVAPPVMPLPEIEVASGTSEGQGRSLVKTMLQTVTSASVREYAPGDSLRWLHWPTTIRKKTPFVRIFEDQPASDWWVILDLDSRVQAGEGQKSTEEHGVILAASLVNRGLKLGKKVGLVSHGSELAWHPPDRGESHLWTILCSLAKIRTGGRPLAQVLARIRSSLRKRTSLVVITSSQSSDWLNQLELLQRSGIVPTVLLLDPVSFGGSGDVDFILERLTKLGVKHFTITSELLDRPENSQQDGFDWLLHHPRRGRTREKWEEILLKVWKNIQVWALVLVFFAGMIRAMGDAVRGLETSLLWGMIAGGVGLGWIFERSRLRGWLIALIHTFSGWATITLWVGGLGEPIREAFMRFLGLLPQIMAWIYKSAPTPYYELFYLSVDEIRVGFSAVGFRLLAWLFDLFKGQPFYDPVAIAFIWGITVWAAAGWVVWGINRYRKPFIGLLPSTALVAFSLALINFSSNNLALMLGTTIALMIFMQYDSQENLWRAKQLSFSESIRSKMSGIAILLAIGLMIISIITPTISIKNFADFIRDMTGKNKTLPYTRSLGLEVQSDPQNPYILDLLRAGGLPNRHLIGSGPELSEQVVMVLRLETLQSGDTVSEVSSQAPIYLRSLIYDKYTGQGWSSRDTKLLDYYPGQQIPIINPKNSYRVRQEIQYIEDLNGIIHAQGDLLSVDQDFQIGWRLLDLNTARYDLFGATVKTEAYRADSIVTVYSSEELQAAGQNYPDWLLDLYMSLPDTIPETVLTLARDLTATEPTPYDRAVAIENYLREIPYSLDVEIGPRDQDIVEYFLFDSRLGYCDYYATAMVVLSRAAGFPARYVMGYLAEDYNEGEDLYVITADQAHAWAEVYFPDYGWVPFEPTAGRSSIDRPQEASPELPEDFQFEYSPLVPDESNFSTSKGPWMFILIASVLGVILGYWGILNWWMARTPISILVPKLYKRIYRYGRWVGIQPQPSDTVYNFANEFKRLFSRASQGNHWATWINQSPSMIDQITQALVIILFAPSLQNNINRHQVIQAYKQFLPRFWLLWLMVRVYRLPILRSFIWKDASGFIRVMRARIPR